MEGILRMSNMFAAGKLLSTGNTPIILAAAVPASAEAVTRPVDDTADGPLVLVFAPQVPLLPGARKIIGESASVSALD